MSERFGMVPVGVIMDASLSAGAVRLYALLASHADGAGYCFPSLGKKAKELGVSKSTVFRWLEELDGKWAQTVSRGRYRVFREPIGGPADGSTGPADGTVSRTDGTKESPADGTSGPTDATAGPADGTAREQTKEQTKEQTIPPNPPKGAVCEVERLFGVYLVTLGQDPGSVGLDIGYDAMLRTALRFRPASDIEAAIRGLAASDFHRRKGFRDLKYAVSKPEQVDRLATQWRGRPTNGDVTGAGAAQAAVEAMFFSKREATA